jgi:hypothetical protein
MSSGDWIIISVAAVVAVLAATGCLQWLFRMLMGAAVVAVLVTAISMSRSGALGPVRDVVNEGAIAPAMAGEVERARDALDRMGQPAPPPVVQQPSEPPKIVIVQRRSDASE